MSVTYSGDPAASARDAVRFLVGDTSTSTGLLADTEIDFLVSRWGSNTYRAAAEAARVLAAKTSDNVESKSVGSLSISKSGQSNRYLELAKSLEAQSKTGVTFAIAAYSGGVSKADKELMYADDDWEKPWFRRGMHDYPGYTDPLVSPST